MNIAVNTRLLLKDRLEGIGWFTHETLKRITQNHPEHRFYFIFDRPYEPGFIYHKNVIPVVAPPKARHPVLFYYWFEKVIPHILKKYKADIFLSPDGYLSLSTHVKSVAVIHDINFAHRPKDLPWLVKEYYNYFFPRFARRADKIATVSMYSKIDICKSYGIDEKKVDVVYNGVNNGYAPLNEKSKEEFRKKYSGGYPYFIYVGSLHKRKNIGNLLRSFELFCALQNNTFKLVVVGEKMFSDSGIEQVYNHLNCKDDIIFTGRLKNTELNGLMASAHALVFIPYFEGFGLPVIEAMASGVPVITSNVTSLPEVAGDAALFCDPFSPEEVADQMLEISTNNELYNNMVTKGLQRAADFSWDNTAKALWQCIEKTF